MLAPHGFDELISEIGDVRQYILRDGTLDPQWQAKSLSSVPLPFPMILSFDHSKTISHFSCHKLLVAIFADLFGAIVSCGLQDRVTSFGGCFAFRPQRSGTKLSTHSWGIAIDLNPETNLQGTVGDMDGNVITIFRDAGFEWGGEWVGKRRDAMHFQFCTGY